MADRSGKSREGTARLRQGVVWCCWGGGGIGDSFLTGLINVGGLIIGWDGSKNCSGVSVPVGRGELKEGAGEY